MSQTDNANFVLAWAGIINDFHSNFNRFQTQIFNTCKGNNFNFAQMENCILTQIRAIIQDRFQRAFNDVLLNYPMFAETPGIFNLLEGLCFNGGASENETYKEFYDCMVSELDPRWNSILDQFNTTFDQVIATNFPQRFLQFRQLIAVTCLENFQVTNLNQTDFTPDFTTCIQQQIQQLRTNAQTTFNNVFSTKVLQYINDLKFDITPLRSRFFDICVAGYVLNSTDIGQCIDQEVERMIRIQNQENPINEVFQVIYDQEIGDKKFADVLRFLLLEACITSQGSDLDINETTIRNCIRTNLDTFEQNVQNVLKEYNSRKDLVDYTPFRDYVLRKCTLGQFSRLSQQEIKACIDDKIKKLQEWEDENLPFFNLRILPYTFYSSLGIVAVLTAYYLLWFYVRKVINPGVVEKNLLEDIYYKRTSQVTRLYLRISFMFYALLKIFRDYFTPTYHGKRPRIAVALTIIMGLVYTFAIVVLIFSGISWYRIQTLDFDLVLQ